ncbi:MAG: hypothetical protein K1X94_23740 [Sandaracinaceae bacterium]|nr:hypothetical protein [Sandaracinaceae bacterium]
MRMPRAAAMGASCGACLALSGCSASVAQHVDAARADVELDASTEGCEPLELGLCTITGTGQPCLGAFEEAGQFTVASDGALASLVTGPQGSQMIVLAARTRGIEPGDPERPASADNPVVEIVVLGQDGAEVSTYRGRAAFTVDPAGSDWLVQPEIFVVMDGSRPDAVEVHATLTDRNGALRCGSLALRMR